jgi:hypothetical protein
VHVVGPPPPSTTTTTTPTTTTTTTTLALCGPITDAVLRVVHVGLPVGDDRLSFKGVIALAPPVAPALDPIANGLVVRMDDGPTTVLDVAVPPGAYDTVARSGWQVNKAGTRWTWKAPKTGGPAALKKVVLVDKSAKTPGQVTFRVTGKDGSYAFSTDVVPSVRLPGTRACFEATFPATPPAKPSCSVAKNTLTCK